MYIRYQRHIYIYIYRVTQKTEAMNFFITSTKIKQDNSNFVHSNFCLCMITPKGFCNLGCFAQKLWSLQNMFQMTSSALETDKQPLGKIVNHSHALLSGDFPEFCFTSTLELNRLFGYTWSFRYPYRQKSGVGFKSGEWGAHSTSHFLVISLPWNRYLSQSRVWFDVWRVTPSCWNHWSSRLVPLRHPSDAQNFLSTAK